MVDSTTLIVIATIAQTVVITFTLLVFIFQFRSQEKAIKESSYQNLMGRYTDFIRMLAEKPELVRLLIQQMPNYKPGREITREEAALYGHMLLAYGILEEAFLLYEKKWIDKDTWDQWAAWLETMTTNRQFAEIHGAASGTFDKHFEDFVTSLIKKSKAEDEIKKEQSPQPQAS